MKNPRLEGIVKRFSEHKKIEGDISEKYQIFTNYLLLKDVYNRLNEEYPYESEMNLTLLENINFGKNNSMAVDGCFFIYKNEILHLNMDDEDIDDKMSSMKDGYLNIVLIQTKSGKFDASDLSTLSDCLSSEFKDQEEWRKFVLFRSKCNALLSTNDKINFKFWCFYVSGQEINTEMFNNPTFTVRERNLINASKTFFWIRKDENIKLEYLDDEKILDLWDSQEEDQEIVNKTINYVEITREIEIPNVGKILFGAISFGELMKIIYNKEKQKRYDLYGYNVRDEIAESEIKNEIINTILKNGDKFILLNNGITIVVDSQEKRGEKGILLQNIRIINGCQTCNAILDVCKNESKYDDFQVSVKIIETQKNEILLGDITYSSNHQNKVTKANLISIHPKMFELEREYKNFEIINNTHFESCLFERREGQYRNSGKKYIDMLAQAKAYISLWEQLPHEAVMYRDEVLDKFSKARENDQFFIAKSLLSGISWFNIYKNIPPLFENARYQIFAVVMLHAIEQELQINDILESKQLVEFDSTLIIKMKLNFKNEVEEVIKAIQESKDLNGEIIFSPSAKSGKIHYRKFYPITALTQIFHTYKEAKNALAK